MYLSRDETVSRAYAKAASYTLNKKSSARLRTVRLSKPISVLWVNARNVFMDDEAEEFLIESDYDGIAQCDDKGALTELALRPQAKYPITLVRDKAAAAFIDM